MKRRWVIGTVFAAIITTGVAVVLAANLLETMTRFELQRYLPKEEGCYFYSGSGTPKEFYFFSSVEGEFDYSPSKAWIKTDA